MLIARYSDIGGGRRISWFSQYRVVTNNEMVAESVHCFVLLLFQVCYYCCCYELISLHNYEKGEAVWLLSFGIETTVFSLVLCRKIWPGIKPKTIPTFLSFFLFISKLKREERERRFDQVTRDLGFKFHSSKNVKQRDWEFPRGRFFNSLFKGGNTRLKRFLIKDSVFKNPPL